MKALRKMYTNEDGVQMFHDLPIPEPAKGIIIEILLGCFACCFLEYTEQIGLTDT